MRTKLKWLIAAGALLLATAATAQTGSAVSGATGDVNYARQNSNRNNLTNNQAYGQTGIDRVGEKKAIRVDQTQETKLSSDEKTKLANALISDMRGAANSLTTSIGKAESQADNQLAKCLRDIESKVSKALESAEGLKTKLDTPGTYSQIRQYGQTAQSALKDVKTCPTKAGASSEGSSVSTTVEQVLADEGASPDFPVTVPPVIMLPPPCASCVR